MKKIISILILVLILTNINVFANDDEEKQFLEKEYNIKILSKTTAEKQILNSKKKLLKTNKYKWIVKKIDTLVDKIKNNNKALLKLNKQIYNFKNKFKNKKDILNILEYLEWKIIIEIYNNNEIFNNEVSFLFKNTMNETKTKQLEYNKKREIIDKYYAKWLEYSKSWKYLKAIEQYKKVIDLNPNYSNAYFNMANQYSNLWKYNEAIIAYKNVIKLNPNDVDAYYNIWIAYLNIKDNNNAIKSYKKAIEIKPESSFYYQLWNSYFNNKEYKKSIIAYEKCINLNPKYKKVQEYYKSTIYIYNITYDYLPKSWTKEYKYYYEDKNYKKVLEVNPNNNKAYIKLANKYYNETYKQIEIYDKAIKNDPYFADFYLYRGYSYYAEKEYKRAIKDYNMAIKYNPDAKQELYNWTKISVYTLKKWAEDMEKWIVDDSEFY